MSTGWPKARLVEVLRLDLDRVPIEPNLSYPMVGVYSFGRGLFEREPIEAGKTSYHHFYRLKAKHVVMSQLFGWEGALALSSELYAGKFVSPQFPTFLCDDVKLDRVFLGWLMKRRSFWEDLGTRATGMGDRRRTLSPDALFACEIPLPPLAEQQRIVARIEELVAKIVEARSLRQEAAREAERLARTSAERSYRDLGAKVGYSRLMDACETITDGDHLTPQFSPAGVCFIFVGNVSTGHLHFQGSKRVSEEYFKSLRPQRVPKRGDILYSSVGATLGVPAIVNTDEPFCFQRHIAILKPDHRKVESRLLWYLLQSRTIFERAWSSTTGTAQPTVPLRAIRELPIPLPSLAEQREVVAYLDQLQTNVDALRKLQVQTSAELDVLMPSILDKAFKGEL